MRFPPCRVQWLAVRVAPFAMALSAACGGDDGGSGGSGGQGSATDTTTPATASTGVASPTRQPAPVLPDRTATVSGTSGGVIPTGFLWLEESVTTPLAQSGVYYVQDEGADMPPLLAPCGTPVPTSGSLAVDGRQILVLSPHLWKMVRLTVYRDAETARQVVEAHRAELKRCTRRQDEGDRTMVWETKDLEIGDEAIFVGGQLYAGESPLNFHYRGVFTRQGRAVFFVLDFGQSTVPPSIHEVEGHRNLAAEMAATLRDQSWAR